MTMSLEIRRLQHLQQQQQVSSSSNDNNILNTHVLLRWFMQKCFCRHYWNVISKPVQIISYMSLEYSA